MLVPQCQKVANPGWVRNKRILNLASEFQGKIEIAFGAFPIGVDHREHCRTAKNQVIVCRSLQIGALAGLDRVSGAAEAEIEIFRITPGQSLAILLGRQVCRRDLDFVPLRACGWTFTVLGDAL